MNPIELLEEINTLDLHFRQLFFNKVVLDPTDYGLKPTASRCLLVLYFNPDAPMNEVAQKLDIEKGSLTPIAKKLEILGLTKRIQSKTDSRVSNMRLTPSGMKQAKIILQNYIDHIQTVFDTMSPSKRQTIQHTLKDLNSILNTVNLKNN